MSSDRRIFENIEMKGNIRMLWVNPLSANPTKWSNTKTIRRLKSANCFSVYDHFVGLALKKGLKRFIVLIFKIVFSPG